MKKVFSSSNEVVHVFAQRTQDSGRAGNIFFEGNGNKLYSYGYHYELARFITGKDGTPAIYINDKGYSSSTSKHISLVRMATRQYKQFFYKDTVDYLQSIYKDAVKSLQTAKKPEKYINPLLSTLARYKDYCSFTGEKIDKALVKSIEKLQTPDAMEKLKAEGIKEKAKALKQYKQLVREFKAGEIEFIRSNYNDVLRIEDGNIRTSQGVKIEREQALQMYKAVKAGIDLTGQRISHYTINRLVNKVYHIGCHKLHVDELLTVGAKL